jgi:replicative DNA helicase
MKTHDANTEAQIIRGILDSPERAFLLSQVDTEHFGHEAVLELFRRVMVFVNAGKTIPTSQVFKNDASLSDDARAIVANPSYVLGSSDDMMAALEILKKYRKARILFQTINQSVQVLQGDSPDIDTLVSTMELMLQRCHSGNDVSEMKHYSYTDIEELSEEVEKDLKVSNEKDFIPTGLGQFDKQSGGLRRKNVLAMASVPGGGKSALSFRMAMNQYIFGYNVCFVSYEMDEIELRYRMLSSESRIDHNEINLKRLSDRKIKLIDERFRSFLSESKNGNRLTIWTPARELTMSQIAVELKAMNYDVVYIDYISLLKAENPKKAMWEVLGDHSRAAKLAANNLNAAVVLLAQYDDEGNKLKYSKAIQANANFVWVWDHGEKEKESGLINIRQLKARNSPLYSFYLEKDFSTFTFNDYFGPTPVAEPPKEEKEEAKKQAKRNRIPGMPELKK